MQRYISTKGVIPVAMAFAVCVSLILAAIIGLFSYRLKLSATRVKRLQAANLAEAGLWEALHRFRTGQWVIADGFSDTVTLDETVKATGTGIGVAISVDEDSGAGNRLKVRATIDRGDIGL